MKRHVRVWRCLPVRFWLVAALLVASLLTACASTQAPDHRPPRALDGALSLMDWSIPERGPVHLDGEWEFYWGRFLTPREFAEGIPTPRALLSVPDVWAGAAPAGQPLPGEGYATYRLRIHDPTPGARALYLPVIRTAYRLWIDGLPVTSSGQVGTSRDESTPRARAEMVDFQSRGGTMELVVQVANFHHRSGGLHSSLTYGTPTQILALHERRVAFSLFLFGSLLILGLHQLGFFARRRQERSTLYFGLFCVLVAIWTLLVRESFLTRLWPGFPWELDMKLEYLVIYAGLPLFALFLRSLYPAEVPSRATAALGVVGLLFSLSVLITPARIYSRTLPAFHAVMVAAAVVLLFALVKAAIRRRPGAGISLLAGAVFAVTVINDILQVDVVIDTVEMAPFGLLFFVFAQATILGSNYAGAFAAVETLTTDLQEMNRTLERRVEDRTRSLALAQRQEAETRSAMLVIAERERIAREIHNSVGHALTTTILLVEAARRLLRQDAAQAGEKLARSQELVRKGLEEVRRAVRAMRAAPWDMELAQALHQLIHETTDHTDTQVETDIQPLTRVTLAQREVLYQAVQEGLTNGIRHGGSTHFTLTLMHRDDTIRLTLADNGRGADSVDPGFGLQSLRERVQELNGSLTVRTAPGEGFTLDITLPADPHGLPQSTTSRT